ncbi:lysophospholipid acyltransferase family protein [Varunaivibrio sulfuroxidans]|uniref:KDO2-lipid IV(A) lauroyltransferase n=1 Tax=Varunaivibrio sulfuroxidans TaxID=1773489 RepID=A0A4R3J6Y2_9PROT|nr:lauroyl acyltransferase [Varunaivibrio sulfuroxidans]TCS60633.1 KDO2-lipid IV(A) lauroyltransferase [Varunaivibrio sulfuroxidans]WES30122.1 lauroyl acyltransferase [Varunaivibrio sulfuroxidans]
MKIDPNERQRQRLGYERAATLGDRVEAFFAHIFFAVVGLLPFSTASAIGGFLGRRIGPRVGVTRHARHNLARAFPEKSEAQINALIREMWDNLGRTIFEYPRLSRLDVTAENGPVEIVGIENLRALAARKGPGLIVTAHQANWELGPLVASGHGITVHSIYRPPSNPLMLDFYLSRQVGAGSLIPKGAKGARWALEKLKRGEIVAIVADQKMNDGIAVPFFGRDAMTAPALAQFALKFDCPIVPVQIVRTGGPRFRAILHPPITLRRSADRRADVLAGMTRINAIIEGWVREHPAQWLWVHKRWGD